MLDVLIGRSFASAAQSSAKPSRQPTLDSAAALHIDQNTATIDFLSVGVLIGGCCGSAEAVKSILTN